MRYAIVPYPLGLTFELPAVPNPVDLVGETDLFLFKFKALPPCEGLLLLLKAPWFYVAPASSLFSYFYAVSYVCL